MRKLVAIAAIAFLGVQVNAQTVVVGGVEIKLPPPTGQCAFDPKHDAEADMIDDIREAVAKTPNRLLSANADCKEIVDWREGRRRFIDNMAQYQVVTSVETRSGSSSDIKSICASIRAKGAHSDASFTAKTQAALETVMQNTRVNETRFLGVFGEDATTCYSAMFLKGSVPGREMEQQYMQALTLVKNRIITYFIVAPRGTKTYIQMYEEHKANVAALQAANR